MRISTWMFLAATVVLTIGCGDDESASTSDSSSEDQVASNTNSGGGGAGMEGMEGGMEGGLGGMEGMEGLGGMGGMEGMEGMEGGMGGGSQSAPKTLAEFASQSFAAGNDKQGIELTYAAAIVDDNYAAILSKYRWVDAIKQPALAVRIGIGLNVTESSGFSGDPKPIGSEQQLPQIGGNRPSGNAGGAPGGFDGGIPSMGGEGGMEGMEGMMEGMGGGGGSSLPADLKKYTGELGEKVVAKLRERIQKGEFGTVLQTALRSSGGGGGMGGGMGGMGGGMGGMGGEGGGGAKNASAIMPGVTMLGQGTTDGILARAATEGIDAVLLFDVQVVNIAKVKLVRNATTLQLFDVASRRNIQSTAVLLNIKMQVERELAKKQKKPDPLDTAIEKVIKMLDMSYKMRKMPALTAESVQSNRLFPLVADKPSNPLRALAEVMFYHQYNLCPDEHRKIAFDQLVGPQLADKLLNGSKQDKLAAVDVYLDVETAKVIGQPQGQQGQANSEGSGFPGGSNQGGIPGGGVPGGIPGGGVPGGIPGGGVPGGMTGGGVPGGIPGGGVPGGIPGGGVPGGIPGGGVPGGIPGGN